MEKRPFPVVTFALCVLSVLVTIADYTSDPASMSTWARLGHFAGGTAYDVWNGHPGALVTGMFVHADFRNGPGIAHLIFNVCWLWVFGSRVETSIGPSVRMESTPEDGSKPGLRLGERDDEGAQAQLGPLAFLLFVIFAAWFSASCELLYSSNIEAVGMSGVVYALFGLVVAGRGKYESWRALLTQDSLAILIGWAVFALVSTYFGWLVIANAAHVGGFIFGYSIGALLLWSGEWSTIPPWLPLRRLVWAGPILGLLIVCLVSATYEPWSAQWNYWNGTKSFKDQDYASAITWYERSLQLGMPGSTAWEAVADGWHNMAIAEYEAHDWKAFKYDKKQEDDALTRAGHPPPPPPPPKKKTPPKNTSAKKSTTKKPVGKTSTVNKPAANAHEAIKPIPKKPIRQ